MMVGYARVSTVDQNPELQLDALDKAGCGRLFTDKGSGADRERPELAAALHFCQKGDTFVAWKLDRVARSLAHLLEIAEELDLKGVAFRSLTECIDTSTATGRLMFHFLGGFVELERSMIRERTMAGLKISRAKGRRPGRVSRLKARDLALARERKALGVPNIVIARTLGVSEAHYYRWMKRANEQRTEA